MKKIQNRKDGHHLNSKYWQNWKKNVPIMNENLFRITIGMVLSDAGMFRTSREAAIKFEQGAIQKDFLYHLFHLYESYSFIIKPGIRYSTKNTYEVKKTFTHKSFSVV